MRAASDKARRAIAIPELLRYTEVSALLKLSPRSVRRLCVAGELKLIYVGTGSGMKSPRVDPASVLEFFERRVLGRSHG